MEMMNRAVEKVLIVDDDAAIRGLLAELLRDDGYEAVEATGGDDALERYKAMPFDLILTDIRMAGMDGITLLKEVRAVNADAHVIIMTSHASMDTALSALKLGAYDYLMKPFESLDLVLAAVARALESVRLQKERELLVASLTRNNLALERLTKLFRERAIRDGLTGLYNHRYFNEALAQEAERARRYSRQLAVLFIDVDHFKTYNDTHGHQRGDDLLRELGTILKNKIRDSDLAARWGGEEFVVLAPETGVEGAQAIAENLRAQVAASPFFESESQPGGAITISIGVAVMDPAEDDTSSLIFRADQAVYEAKRAGRNLVRVAA